MFQLWDTELVQKISFHPKVERVVSLGTLFAVELQVEDSEAGYVSLPNNHHMIFEGYLCHFLL